MSPWTRTPDGRDSRVDHTVYEHSSFLRFMSENWGLPHLTARDRHTNSLGKAFRGFRSYDPDPSFVPYDAPLHLLVEPTVEELAHQLEPLTSALVPAAVPNRVVAPAPPPVEGPGSDLHRLAETGFLDNLKFDLDQRFEDSFLHRRPELLREALAGLGV